MEIINFFCKIFLLILLIGTPLQMLYVCVVLGRSIKSFIKNYFIFPILEKTVNYILKILGYPIIILVKFRYKILVINRINRALDTPRGYTNEANYLLKTYIFARILKPNMIIEHILSPHVVKNIKNNSNFLRKLSNNNTYDAYNILSFSTSNVSNSIIAKDEFYTKLNKAKFLLPLILLQFEEDDLRLILEKINEYGVDNIERTFKNGNEFFIDGPLFYGETLNLKALTYYKHFYHYLIKSQSYSHFTSIINVYNNSMENFLNDKVNRGVKLFYSLNDHFIEPFESVCEKVYKTLDPVIEKYLIDDSIPIEWLLELEDNG